MRQRASTRWLLEPHFAIVLIELAEDAPELLVSWLPYAQMLQVDPYCTSSTPWAAISPAGAGDKTSQLAPFQENVDERTYIPEAPRSLISPFPVPQNGPGQAAKSV